MAIENTILAHLVHDEEYGRKVMPFIKEEYFSDYQDKVIYQLIIEYVNKYNSFPSKEALAIDLSNRDGINEEAFKQTKEIISHLKIDADTQEQWLLDQTEKWCQDRAIYLALLESIKIADGGDKKISKEDLVSSDSEYSLFWLGPNLKLSGVTHPRHC